MQRQGVTYALHHIGIPTHHHLVGARFSPKVGMSTTDDRSGPVPVQWHHFEEDSLLPPLLKEMPHIAYKVSDLQAAIVGHVVVLGPYEPIDGYRVAVIDNHGAPIELVETELTDEELWKRAEGREHNRLCG